MTKVSNCGLICDECNFYQKNCTSCFEVKGKTFWAQDLPGKICPLFNCSVNDKKFTNCGDCNDLPCKMFNDLKDPSISDEEHKKNIVLRVNRLRELVK